MSRTTIVKKFLKFDSSLLQSSPQITGDSPISQELACDLEGSSKRLYQDSFRLSLSRGILETVYRQEAFHQLTVPRLVDY